LKYRSCEPKKPNANAAFGFFLAVNGVADGIGVGYSYPSAQLQGASAAVQPSAALIPASLPCPGDGERRATW